MLEGVLNKPLKSNIVRMKLEKQRENEKKNQGSLTYLGKTKILGICKKNISEKSALKVRKYQVLYKNIFVKLYLLELDKTVPIYINVIVLMITRNCYNL